MRESAMGRSKRKRSSRVSSGGGSMRASHGLGPLQEVRYAKYTQVKILRGPSIREPEGAIPNPRSRGVESKQETKDLSLPGDVLVE